MAVSPPPSTNKKNTDLHFSLLSRIIINMSSTLFNIFLRVAIRFFKKGIWRSAVSVKIERSNRNTSKVLMAGFCNFFMPEGETLWQMVPLSGLTQQKGTDLSNLMKVEMMYSSTLAL
jgi:hypothetical protein